MSDEHRQAEFRCPNGHTVPFGSAFCAICGAPVDLSQSPESSDATGAEPDAEAMGFGPAWSFAIAGRQLQPSLRSEKFWSLPRLAAIGFLLLALWVALSEWLLLPHLVILAWSFLVYLFLIRKVKRLTARALIVLALPALVASLLGYFVLAPIVSHAYIAGADAVLRPSPFLLLPFTGGLLLASLTNVAGSRQSREELRTVILPRARSFNIGGSVVLCALLVAGVIGIVKSGQGNQNFNYVHWGALRDLTGLANSGSDSGEQEQDPRVAQCETDVSRLTDLMISSTANFPSVAQEFGLRDPRTTLVQRAFQTYQGLVYQQGRDAATQASVEAITSGCNQIYSTTATTTRSPATTSVVPRTSSTTTVVTSTSATPQLLTNDPSCTTAALQRIATNNSEISQLKFGRTACHESWALAWQIPDSDHNGTPTLFHRSNGGWTYVLSGTGITDQDVEATGIRLDEYDQLRLEAGAD